MSYSYVNGEINMSHAMVISQDERSAIPFRCISGVKIVKGRRNVGNDVEIVWELIILNTTNDRSSEFGTFSHLEVAKTEMIALLNAMVGAPSQNYYIPDDHEPPAPATPMLYSPPPEPEPEPEPIPLLHDPDNL